MALSKTKLQRFIANSESMKNDPDYPIFEAGHQQGVEEGRLEMQNEALSWLQEQYMAKEVERGSVKGDAILELLSGLSAHLKALK